MRRIEKGLGDTWVVGDEAGRIGGVIAAITFLALVAYFISQDFRSKPQRTDFNEQK